tara:strand:+ start:579 stop:749 length:171 start_codon:yes stop_codon:yes gene_type:complete
MLYSIKQASDFLGVGRTFTYGLIKQGRLETIKLGSRTLVKVDSIKALIERAKDGAA